MSDERYRVSHSGVVSDQLRAVFARARAEGVRAVTAQAAQWIVEEMERTPFEFGESREYLQHAELHMRIAFVSYVYVTYGIHEASRTVFVKGIGWRRRA